MITVNYGRRGGSDCVIKFFIISKMLRVLKNLFLISILTKSS